VRHSPGRGAQEPLEGGGRPTAGLGYNGMRVSLAATDTGASISGTCSAGRRGSARAAPGAGASWQSCAATRLACIARQVSI